MKPTFNKQVVQTTKQYKTEWETAAKSKKQKCGQDTVDIGTLET